MGRLDPTLTHRLLFVYTVKLLMAEDTAWSRLPFCAPHGLRTIKLAFILVKGLISGARLTPIPRKTPPTLALNEEYLLVYNATERASVHRKHY